MSNAKNETVKSSDFKNKVVLIHFWSAKHKDFDKEMKALDDIQKKMNNPSVIFLKINTDKNIGEWRKAVKKFKKDKYQVFGNDANTYTQNIYQYFELNSTNATKIIMDKKGNLAQSIKSQFNENELLVALRNEFVKK